MMRPMNKTDRYTRRMRYLLLLAVCCILALRNAQAQEQQSSNQQLSDLIHQIEQNHTGLMALKRAFAAEKAANRVGLAPEDPRVEVNYLKPNPRLADHRLDYSITQDLDFPTVYRWRRKVAQGQDQLVDQQYLLQRSEVVSQAVQTWLQWVYFQEENRILRQQHDYAERLLTAFEQAFEAGSVSALERNRARIHAAQAQRSLKMNEIELRATEQQLLRLNGGQAIDQLPTQYPDWALPTSFNEWFAEISGQQGEMQVLLAELEVNKQQQSLARAMQWPSLSVGYMREQDIEVDFKGVTVGVSIPLWHNRQRTRHARLQQQAQESLIADAEQQFYLKQQHLFDKASALWEEVTALRSTLADSREPSLLQKALNLGQITLIDYLVELGIYYQLHEQLLTAEWDYYLTQAEMRKWWL